MSWTCRVPASDWALPKRRPARTSSKKNVCCSGVPWRRSTFTYTKWFCGIWARLASAEASSRKTSARVSCRTSAPPCFAGTVTASSPEAERRSNSSRGSRRSESRAEAPARNSSASAAATARASTSSAITLADIASARRGQQGRAAEGRRELVDHLRQGLGRGRGDGDAAVLVRGDVLVEGEPALDDVRG